jgi:periplasmic protein TonB
MSAISLSKNVLLGRGLLPLAQLPLAGRWRVLQRKWIALDYETRFQYAVLGSMLLHAFVLFGITIRPPDLSKLSNIAPALEVVLVNAKSKSRPLHADTLAQHNLDGGGTTDLERSAKSPLPVSRNDKPTTEVAMESSRQQQLEREARKLLTQVQSQTKVESAATQPQQQTETRVSPTAADIMNKSLEIARLEAQISKDWDAYQKRPRRSFVGARTREYRFSRYIEDWRIKVERIGTVNYPAAARDQKIYGSLQLTVSIRPDGAVDNVEINRSSGHKVLDEAAVRIVHLGSPYAAFPPDITKDTDILSITRTWIFTRSDQLATE